MTAAATAVVLLGLLAVFQLALIYGAPIGRFAWGVVMNAISRSKPERARAAVDHTAIARGGSAGDQGAVSKGRSACGSKACTPCVGVKVYQSPS